MQLAPPTPAALEAILARSSQLLELGAGEGIWAQALRERGANVVALDPLPLGPGVLSGSHLDASSFAGRSLLVVWPPDATDVNAWATGDHPWLFLLGSPIRYRFTPPCRCDLAAPVRIGGRKGMSELHAYRLAPPAA